MQGKELYIKKIEVKIDVLEDVVLGLGQDIENIRVLLDTKCHASFGRYV